MNEAAVQNGVIASIFFEVTLSQGLSSFPAMRSRMYVSDLIRLEHPEHLERMTRRVKFLAYDLDL
jgi:hypothetical protein